MTPDLRALLLRVRINAVSSMDDLMTPGSPQAEALEWITNLDTRYVCPDDPTLKQRYSLAAFYYSTRGDRWNMCDAPDDFGNPLDVAAANARCMIEPMPGSGSDAWLTPSNECLWGGVICDNDGNVERIDIGMYLFFVLIVGILCDDSIHLNLFYFLLNRTKRSVWFNCH